MDTVIKRNATRRLIIAILSFVVGFLFIETVCYGFEQIDSNGVKLGSRICGTDGYLERGSHHSSER